MWKRVGGHCFILIPHHPPITTSNNMLQWKLFQNFAKINPWWLKERKIIDFCISTQKLNVEWVIVSYKIINCSEPFCLATAISPPTWPRADISAILLHHLFTFTTTTFKIQEAKINSVTHRRNYTITHLSKFVQLCVSVDPTKADLWEWLPSGSPEK